MDKMKAIKFRADVSLKARIEAQAREEGVTKSDLMRRVLRETLALIPSAPADIQLLLPPKDIAKFKALSAAAGCSFGGMLKATLEEGIKR